MEEKLIIFLNKVFKEYERNNTELILDSLLDILYKREKDCPIKIDDLRIGAEKIVIVFKKTSRVLKIVPNNYRECEVYIEAREKGLSDFFARTYFWKVFNILGYDCFCYWQDKIELKDRPSSYYLEELEKVPKSNKALYFKNRALYNGDGEAFFPDCFLPFYLSLLYPDYVIQKFLSFLKKESINDVHRGNFAIIDKKIKIFDYSGYDIYENYY